jgi:predicted dehydrogenase
MKTIRWGILGTGTVARDFAEALRLIPQARLNAIGSRSREAADKFASDFGIPRAHARYADLARDPEIDVIYVATLNSEHKNNCILALESGKAVLCEKPFTLDAGEARAIIEVARRTGRFCMEGMWMRFVPLVRELVEMVRSGTIGELRMVTANLGFAFEFDPKHRVFDRARGGGSMLDLGVYGLSFAFQFLGRPTEVATQALLGQTGVDEQATVLLGFSNQSQAVVTSSLRSRLSNDAVLIGSKGSIHVHEPLYAPQTATLSRLGQHKSSRGPFSWLRGSSDRPTITRKCLGKGYTHEAMEVMQCLEAGERESPIMPLDESLAIMEVMDELRAIWDRTGKSS